MQVQSTFKNGIILLSVLLCSLFATAQWNTSGTDINNTNSGNVGIGTGSPGYKLEVIGSLRSSSLISMGETYGGTWEPYGTYSMFTSNTNTDAMLFLAKKSNSNILLKVNNGGRGVALQGSSGNLLFLGGSGETLSGIGNVNGTGNLSFMYSTGSNVQAEGARLTTGGNFGIGTTTPTARIQVEGESFLNGKVRISTLNFPATGNYKLAVGGDIIAEKVRVKLQSSGWPDYVFHRQYPLMSLKEVENYIAANNHLPGVPAASEVEREGLDLGDGQAVLLKKLEELTLYIIDINKRLEQLEAENKELKKAAVKD